MDTVHLENGLVTRCSYCGTRMNTGGFFLRPGVRLCSRDCLQYFIEQEADI